MDCSSCHAVHGAIADRMLNRPTLNETCFQCHAEKRGPFLYEHAPVREDCAACHTPHGSNHPVLLKTRVPQLCQQCHMAVFHPSEVYTGPDTANGIADIHQLERGCMNCHQEVHGSNHPSGVRWTR
jgi:DmsE family decaheme c-type cytochrome